MGGENPGEAVLMRNISVRKMNFRKRKRPSFSGKKMPAFALALSPLSSEQLFRLSVRPCLLYFRRLAYQYRHCCRKDSIYSTKTHDLERLILQNITARVTYSGHDGNLPSPVSDNITLWDASGNAVTAPQNLTAGNYTFRITIGSYKGMLI